jgi:hypothetical protein
LEWDNGGFFLALAYFGTDQSQVGYLSGRSVRESQMGLIMNGFKSADAVFYITNWSYGFVFFQFNPVPLNFNPNNKVSVYNSYKAEYQVLEQKLDAPQKIRK